MFIFPRSPLAPLAGTLIVLAGVLLAGPCRHCEGSRMPASRAAAPATVQEARAGLCKLPPVPRRESRAWRATRRV